MILRPPNSRGISHTATAIIVVLIIGATSVVLLGGTQFLANHTTTEASTSSSGSTSVGTATTKSTTTSLTTQTSTISSISTSITTPVTTTSSSSSTSTSSSSYSMSSAASSASSTTSSSASVSTTTLTSTNTTTNTATSSSAAPSSILVASEFGNGTSIIGVYTELELNGQNVSTGYTPVTFQVVSGQNYTVAISDSKNLYFNRWSSNFSSRVIPVAAGASQVSITAVFTTSPESPPSTPYSITVDSSALNGTTISGYLIDLRVGGYAIESGFTPVTFTNLEPGLEYQVVAYWAGNYYFRHFSNGDLNRYELLTFNSTGSTTASYDAMYEYIAPSQAATLNVIAEFPNGTQIGTTFNNTGYIEHTPGLWLTVTPPGATTPYTGSFTGGSLLPFVLLSGQSYTVQMTLGFGDYSFAYWQGSGSTNATRTITLDQNATTIVAIYEQAQASPMSQAGLWSHTIPFALASFSICPVSFSFWCRRSAANQRSIPGGAPGMGQELDD
jgi:hypothetical protein